MPRHPLPPLARAALQAALGLACLASSASQGQVGGEAVVARREGARRPSPTAQGARSPIRPERRVRPLASQEPQQFTDGRTGPPLALEAPLRAPHRLLALADGSLLIAEAWASRVSRLAPDGRLHPFAGGTTQVVGGDADARLVGDGGPAVQAVFNSPTAMAADASGNVFVCDWQGNRIRRIEAQTGLISTLVGARPMQGNLMSFATLDPGAPVTAGMRATEAAITRPHSVAADAQGRCVFVCQEGLFRVEAAGTLTPLQPPAGLGAPAKLVSSLQGEVYAAYAGGQVVQLQDDALVPLAGAARGPLPPRFQLAASGAGRLVLMAEGALHAFEGGSWRRLMGLEGVPTPAGLAATAAAIYVSAEGAGRVYRCDPVSGSAERVAGLEVDPDQPLSGEQVQLRSPSALALDRRGRLLVADGPGGVIWQRSDDDTYTRVVGNGAPPDHLQDLTASKAVEASIGLTTAISVSIDGTIGLSGGDLTRQRLREVTPDGTIREVALPAGINPLQAVRDADGRWIISDAVLTPVPSGRIVRLAGDRVEELVPRKPLRVCHGLLPRSDGSLYFCDALSSVVYKRDPDGEVFVLAGNEAKPPGFAGDGGPANLAQLQWPMDLALDDRGHLYVADAGNHRVRRIEVLTGVISTVAGEGGLVFAGKGPEDGLREPCALLFDRAGNLLVADSGHHEIKRIERDTLK